MEVTVFAGPSMLVIMFQVPAHGMFLADSPDMSSETERAIRIFGIQATTDLAQIERPVWQIWFNVAVGVT